MRYGILGPLQVRDDAGREIPVGGPRLRALLARLLVEPGRVVGSDRLIDELYGPAPPAGAANALQSQVSRLRRLLPVPVTAHPAGYRLAAAAGEVDAHRFATLADEGQRALAAGAAARVAELLTEALAQWRGPALADVDAPFAGPRVARLEELRRSAAEDLIDARLARGDEPGRLVAELRELVAADPLRERPRGQLMRALAGAGRTAEALAEFAQLRRRLAEELGTDPSPELVAVHRAVLRGRPVPAAPAGEPADGGGGGSPPPAQLTSFVGREEELRRLAKLLAEARLVTLTGPGGAGKTRLAIEAASRRGEPTRFADLAPVTSGAEVPQAVLAALGLRETGLRDAGPRAAGRPDPVSRMVAALAGQRLLLVLDNCEHVIGAAGALSAQILAGCAAVSVLATSREPLGLTGEVLCPVAGLPLPPEGTPPEAAATFPAVRLFADRAADVAGTVRLDAAEVERICRRLDGLPLAIELAAARLRSLPVTEIAARLDDRFRLLSRGDRTAAPRHQTLRAVVGWSWDLLAPAEQTLARRLTVFTGGATVEAAAAVCGVDPGDAVDLLAGLVEKSFVEAAGGRYRMLETIRAYGAERLAEAAEADRTGAAHTAYFLALAGTADPQLRRRDQLEWLARLDAERDNLHAALRRAVGSGDLPAGLRLVSGLAFYWWLRGLRGEGAVLAGEVLAAAGDRPPPGLAEEYAVCVLMAATGQAGTGGGEGADPAGRLPSGLRAAAQTAYGLDTPPRQPFLYFLSGMVSGPPAGGPEAVAALVSQVAAAWRGDPWLQALGPLGQALTWGFHGEYRQAEREAERAVSQFRALGERWGLMMALSALGELANWQREPARGATAIAEALRLAEELGSTTDVADLLRIRGEGRFRDGDLAGAEADYRRAEVLATRSGAPELRAATQLGLAELAWRRGQAGPARRLAGQAAEVGPAGSFAAEETRAGALLLLGRIAESAGEPATAAGHYRRVLATTVGGLPVSSAAAARAALARLTGPPSADGAPPSADGA